MNTIGLVAISILAALFLFALLAGVAALAWMSWTLKKQLAEVQKQSASVYAETEKLIESAKFSFATIRSEVTNALDHNSKGFTEGTNQFIAQLGKVLDEHRQETRASIQKINAEALQSVAVRLTQVCVRAEKAIGVFQQLILDTEKSPGAEYGAESYAPEESAFGPPPSGFGLSSTAQLDQAADQEENAGMFTESATV